MVRNPGTDQFPWAPFQVFQFRISPESKTIAIHKKYTTLGGEQNVYEYSKSYVTKESRTNAFGDIYGRFSEPYYRNRIGGGFSRARYTPDTFTVVIGVVDLGEKHEEPSFDGIEQPSISYELLFEYLDAKGYTPLSVIFKSRKKIESEIERAVMRLVRSSKRGISKQSFVDALSSVGRKWAEKVREYIYGGEKPKLGERTVEYFREKKAQDDGSLYPKGMSAPLVESGQLAEAIGFLVFVEQSDEIKKFISDMSKVESKIRADQRRSSRSRRVKSAKRIKEAVEKSAPIGKPIPLKRRKSRSPIPAGDEYETLEQIAEETINRFKIFVSDAAHATNERNPKLWPEYLKDQVRSMKPGYENALKYLMTLESGRLFLKRSGIPIK